MSITAQAESQNTAVKLVQQAIENAQAFGVSADRLYETVKEKGIGTGQPTTLVEIQKPTPDTLTIYTVWGILPDLTLRLFGAVDGPTLDNEPMIWDGAKQACAGLVGPENVRIATTEVPLPLQLLKPIHQP